MLIKNTIFEKQLAHLKFNAKLLKLLFLCFLVGSISMAGAQSLRHEYSALAYREVSNYWVPPGSSPESVCESYAAIWGWDENGYSMKVISVSGGRWKCQRYYQNVIEPDQYTFVLGGCQVDPVSLGALTGSYVDYPYWDDQKGVCYCNGTNSRFNRDIEWCEPVSWTEKPILSESASFQSCKAPAGFSVGNPIVLATSEKHRIEVDFEGSGPLPLTFSRIYRSGYRSSWQSAQHHPMGKAWRHNHSASLVVNLKDISGNPTAIEIVAAEGSPVIFTRLSADADWISVDSADKISGSGTGDWTYKRTQDDTVLIFNRNGLLLKKLERNGWQTSYIYDGDRLVLASDNFGHVLGFQYNSSGLLSSVVFNGRVVSYIYDGSSRLSKVIYPDGKSRDFVYENSSFPYALTGIFDENGARWGSFAYDGRGRAISTELSGSVDRYQVSYPSASSPSSSAVVIDPLGTIRSYSYGTNFGKLAISSASLPSGLAEADASSRVQDANGLITSETDFRGVQSSTTWNVARRLPTTVVRAAGTPEAKTTTTQWHSTWALPTLVTEEGRTTAYTYDALGQRLSRTVTHTAAGNKVQTTSWTYNPQGLVATETAPNGAVTSYAYDTSGNVLSATNALGHATSYAYDSANRMVRQTAPNGLATAYTWDVRDRLLTQVVGSQQTTTLSYTPFGTIATLTLPTGLSISYTYDAAHRLTGWSNNRGESGTFTLDAMGNRTAEQIRNAAGALAWTTARTINNINRVASQTDGGSQTRTFGYDANGERVRETNGLNQSTQYGLDSLRRLKTITDAANASASLKYDTLDAVTEATDFKGVVTNFTRDAQGNAVAEVGTDIGARSTTYDALGLPSQIVDAMGQATTIQRDALGRPTQLNFADGKSTVLRYDLTGSDYNVAGTPNASIGYLSEIQDRSGSTQYQRDAFGRVVRKTQTLINGVVGAGRYSYTAAGLLDTIVYPGGPDHVLQHVYDATGRLTAMNWRGQPLITGLTWNPLGQPTGWTWAFGAVSGLNGVNLATTRSYDTAGRLVNVTTGDQTVLSYAYDAAGRVNSLSQLLAEPVTPSDPNSAITTTLRSWLASYDAAGRLISFNRSGSTTPTDTASFTYDANGNRTTSSRVVDGVTTNRTYGITGNRLTDFAQSINGTSTSTTSVPYTYNANRDLTSDGLHTYTYDAEGRLSTATTGATDASPTTRYAHNALGQRVFKTEPQYPPAEGDENDTGFMQSLINFFSRLWSPATAPAEVLGYAYAYDEQGSLIGEYGLGGAHSAGVQQYVYLPTASGSMPIVVMSSDTRYALTADHLNTPRRATAVDGNLRWQWGYSAFGDEVPTIADRRFNKVAALESDFSIPLRYPGQYFDVESGLHYNYFRTYSPSTGRYTQSDPIGLDGGWNRFGYVDGNALGYSDPRGLCPICLTLPALGGGVTLGDLGLGAVIGGAMLGLDRVFNGAVPELPISGAAPHRDDPVTGSGTRQWEKPGTIEDADRDFDACRPTNVQDKGKGIRVGTLPNGDRIIVRPDSDSGQPTIEIQRPDGRRSRDKVRYGP